jgi:chromosome segregation ATPase
MSPRKLLWIALPTALSLSMGILWKSAQDGKKQPEGLKVGEMADKVQAREKAVSIKEATLSQMEQRLNTLQATLLQEQEKLSKKEKALEDEKTRLEAEHKKELERLQALEKAGEEKRAKEIEKLREEHARELAKIKEEPVKKKPLITVDEQLIRTYEAMTPAAAARALAALASTNSEVAAILLASMTPKKAAKLLDQLVPLEPKLAGDMSERVGTRTKEETR